MRDPNKKLRTESESHNRDRWLISYADLVTLLLAMFIVMYAASDKERAQKIAESFSAQNIGGSGILPENTSLKDDRAKFESKLLENTILIQKTKMRQTKDGLVISLSEAGFFAPGEAAVNVDAESVLNTLADTLLDCESRIRIEGHTDSTPISNAKYPSNWELSMARASSVLAKLIDRKLAPERFSAAGYGGFQPIADNSTPEGRAQNRRVDVVILGDF